MTLTYQDVKRMVVAFVILLLVVLCFFVIKPLLLTIVAGLLLAYLFNPIHKRVIKIVREKNTATLIVCAIVIIIIVLPLWFLIPIVIQQLFDFFNVTQNIDFSAIVTKAFPVASEDFKQSITSAIFKFIGDLTSKSINSLVNILLNIPTVLLHLAVIIFVFFFSLRDQKELGEFVTGISPFRKDKEKILIERFKDITSSILFGYIAVGILQGIVLGIGLWLFGIPRVLTFTIMAIFASILPMIGPWLVWVPVSAYLLFTGDVGKALAFALYGGLLVSTLDNFLRPYIIARKTRTASVIVLIGMIGGLIAFGLLGIILGPLLLSYMIIFLRAYRDKTLSDMFSSE